jgi:O-antigen/teichoic acid export membrane protein
MLKVSLNTIIIALLNIAFHLILSRKLGPAQYGELDTLLTINSAVMISVSAVSFIITRFVSYYRTRQQYDKMKYLARWAFVFFFFIGFIACIFTMIIAKDVAMFLNMDVGIIMIFSILLWISFLMPIIEGILRGLQEFRLIGVYKILDMFLRVSISLILVFLGLQIKSVIIGLVIGSAVALIFAVYFLKDNYIVKSHHTEMKDIYIFAIPVFLACIFLALLMNADMVLVKHFFDPQIAGQYAAAGALAKLIVGIAIASAGVMFPKIVEHYSNGYASKAVETLRNTLKMTLCIGTIMTLAMASFPGTVSRLIFGPQYVIDYMLSIYAVAMLLLSITCILMFYNLAAKKYTFVYVMFFMAFITIYQIWHYHATVYSIVWALLVINVLVTSFMVVNNKKELFGA